MFVKIQRVAGGLWYFLGDGLATCTYGKICEVFLNQAGSGLFIDITKDGDYGIFGCEVLVGASRKSMIDKIISAPVEERLSGTLAIHLKAVENGASIVRCHDVAEHTQALVVFNALR